ncbi:hypothetical protein N0B51_09600 [Tsuneonella sp. YG55]|uniref:Uncharacterized protein n=1 Tax=Tsuneonella litorea TaxID=2976475 RepID=A0A9X2W1J7_9SPHN|nr:hypothetical protein [Tsuneonella litorea]
MKLLVYGPAFVAVSRIEPLPLQFINPRFEVLGHAGRAAREIVGINAARR